MSSERPHRPPTVDVVRGALQQRGIVFREEDAEETFTRVPVVFKVTRFVLPSGAYLVVFRGRYNGFSLDGVRQPAGVLDDDLERVCRSRAAL